MAAIQAAPVFFEKKSSTEKACRLIMEAAAKGANVAAFGEAWLPGYPFFFRSPESELKMHAKALYIEQAIEIPGPETNALCETAQENGIDVVIGVAELDTTTRGTVYCTLLFISSDGEILGKHRKLKPADGERTVWGEGGSAGLRVYERPYGRISGLNCWEHIMMLPSYALASQGTQIHIASWPSVDDDSYGLTLSRAFAIQSACYVIAAGTVGTTVDVPESMRGLGTLGLGRIGGSVIIDPTGTVIAGPVDNEEMVLVAEGSLDENALAKSFRDIGGHYSRPDVFTFDVVSDID